MQNTLYKILYTGTTLLCLTLITTRVTHAQESSLTVSPPLIEIEALPPTTLETPLSIRNNSEDEIELQVVLRPFIQSARKNGEVEFLKDTDNFPGANKKITNHIEVRDDSKKITSLTLLPKEEKKLDLYIGLGKDEPYSDYYFAIIFLPPNATTKTNKEDENGSNIRGGIGMNVLLSVGPKDSAKGQVDSFAAPSFLQSGPVPFTVSIKNTGSHYITPTGSIVIENVFGQKIGKVTLRPANILTGSSRMFVSDEAFKEQLKTQKADENTPKETEVKIAPTVMWPEKFLLGPYTATLKVRLSPTSPEIERQIHFFAFPGKLLIALFLILLIFFVLKKRVDARRNQ